jgi:hypothetical protein
MSQDDFGAALIASSPLFSPSSADAFSRPDVTFPLMQLYGVVGSFLAARAVGRTTLADLILTERASPQRVARLFTLSASKDSGRDLAFILLSGAFARCRARPDSWLDAAEHELARAALARQLDDNLDKVISELAGQAVDTVARRWDEIEMLATDILAASIFRKRVDRRDPKNCRFAQKGAFATRS